MKAVTLVKYDSEKPLLECRERELSPLKPGEVQIRLHASPINPSDLMFLRGLYGIKKKAPVAAGFEGSGTITGLGEAVTQFRVGDKVSCVSGFQDGTWAEEFQTGVENCILLKSNVSLDQGATFFVNPMTAWAMVSQGQREGHTAFVQTAAASALGKMVIRLCHAKDIPLINLVRRKEQKEDLEKIGAQNVLITTEPNHEKEFYKLAKKLTATYAMDAVAGQQATQLVELLPYGSKVVCYGALSEETFQVNSGIILFQKKRIEGFWLSSWIYDIGLEDFQKEAVKAQEYIDSIFFSEIHKRFQLNDFESAISYYKSNMSAGKVVFIP